MGVTFYADAAGISRGLMRCGAGRWSGTLKSLLWGAVSRQGGRRVTEGVPLYWFSGLGDRRKEVLC